MRVIGLTGGIASGKSTVARLLAERGIPVIDADQLSREVVLPGSPALAAIVQLCSSGVLLADGSLDRQALAGMVFRDPPLRRQLEAILHPAIKVLAEEKLAELRRGGAVNVVYMAPLLVEAGATDRVDEIWVVYLDRERQISRTMARDGLSREEAEQRLAAQMSMEEKASHGRIVIDNRGTLAELEELVRDLCRRELGLEA
jgi:dephospho-CoA kinase